QVDNNRYWKSKANEHQFTSTGSWYYSGKFTDNNGYTEYASGDWYDNRTDLSASSYFSVNDLPQPTPFKATTQGSRRIDLSWAHDNTYTTVLVVAREGAAITDDPENGTQYSVGSSLGNGTVIYRGTDQQFTHTTLSENTSYYYRIYTWNNDYYSTTSDDTKQNVTTEQAPVTYHTISSFTGSEGDFGTSENVGTDENTEFYITWDSDYLYAAIFSDMTYTEGNEKFNIGVDVDPGGANGASIESFGGYNFAAKNDGYHELDYIVQWDDDFTNDIKLFDGSGGTLDGGTDKNYSNYVASDDQAVEIRIPWSDLGGRPTSTWGIILWSCWGDDKAVSYSFPTSNPTGDASTTPLVVEDYYLFNSAGTGVNPGADGSDNSLPIELQSFTASLENQKVILNWETASELDNSGFNIFRSGQENGGYMQINEELIDGAGNSSTTKYYQYIDQKVIPGNQYWYKLQDVSFAGETEMHGPVSVKLESDLNNQSAESFALYPGYPNPFNPFTNIRFDMREDADLNIAIYNIQGQKIKTLIDDDYPAGRNYSVQWNGTDQQGNQVSAGVYLCKMKTSTGFQKIRKMVLVR
ncbi:MAG TPA: FlgD immunoglobulin-like domain containing protein, partial [bacterium]|nr:FlgD immunoglobulin-like domain containing protein [bacterium]